MIFGIKIQFLSYCTLTLSNYSVREKNICGKYHFNIQPGHMLKLHIHFHYLIQQHLSQRFMTSSHQSTMTKPHCKDDCLQGLALSLTLVNNTNMTPQLANHFKQLIR